MTKEDWREREHKKIALEKLGDAVVLFKRDRYLASFYLIGYVFEMGIQYELKRLGEIRLRNETALAVVRRLAADAITFYQQKNPQVVYNLWEQARELQNLVSRQIVGINGLYEFLTKLAQPSNNNNADQQKQLSAIIKNRPLFWALVKGRLDSNTPGVEGHHDTVRLLETLAEWYLVLGAPVTVLAIYEDFKSLRWKVELRYEYMLNREGCQKAHKAIRLAYRLLTQLMGYKEADLPNIQKLKC